MYIDPLLYIHSDFKNAKEFYDTLLPDFYAGMNKPIGLEEIARANRNLIVGEPGIGKTLLLERLSNRLTQDGVQVQLVALRERTSSEKIDDFVRASNTARRALLLDGLDEVQASLFPSILQKIRDVSQAQPTLEIYLTSRWVFINRYAANFSKFRFVTISPFTLKQVDLYLRANGYAPADIDALVGRVMSFRHNMLVIQIPRYLGLLVEFSKKHGIDRVADLSRNELFEYFIYSKLEMEDERLNTDKRTLVKRVLEKLALTMEIYQTNTILKDEMMTFFDDLKSDLKVAALSQVDLQVFFEKTLLKNNHDSIEFDNTEFQEYLAAKEIARFEDPRRVAFEFAVDQRINEFQPSWFNALTFLIDMQPGLLEQFVEFSGIRGERLIDEEFNRFLSRINPGNASPELRRTLFSDLLAYHRRHLQWMPAITASVFPGLFEPPLENLLKSEIAAANAEDGTKRSILLANVATVVGYLLRAKENLDLAYWRTQLLAMVSDPNSNEVLVRRGLFALEHFNDPSIVEALPTALLEGDGSIAGACVKLCVALNPESPVSLRYFVEGTKRGQLESRYGFYALKGRAALSSFLKAFAEDDSFRYKFLEKASIFKEHDREVVNNIDSVFDENIGPTCYAAIARSFHHWTAQFAQYSVFVAGLGEILRKRSPDFFSRIIQAVRQDSSQTSLYYLGRLFASLVCDRPSLDQFLKAMREAGEEARAFEVLLQVRYSNRPGAEDLFEAGRSVLPEQYKYWEARQKEEEVEASVKLQAQLADFRNQLEPAPGQYNLGVFAFYTQNADTLDQVLTAKDRERLEKLITGSVFSSINPAGYDITITEDHPGGGTSYTLSSNIRLFRDALMVADHLKIDLSPFRAAVINFIPFAYNEDLQVVFRLVKNITPQEFAPVLDVYSQQRSDLWRHMPESFIEAVERYHIIQAAPAEGVRGRAKAPKRCPAEGAYRFRVSFPRRGVSQNHRGPIQCGWESGRSGSS